MHPRNNLVASLLSSGWERILRGHVGELRRGLFLSDVELEGCAHDGLRCRFVKEIGEGVNCTTASNINLLTCRSALKLSLKKEKSGATTHDVRVWVILELNSSLGM